MIRTPTLLLDEAKCRANIDRMVSKAKSHQMAIRPHFKTHQSLEIGRWFKEVGVSKITVSSLDMATYFSEEWQNITVAFPVNILELPTINRLSEKIQLNLLLESKASASYLKNKLKHSVNFFIKINIGNNRTGLLPKDTNDINDILDEVKSSNTLNFFGFLAHAGHTYSCRNKEEILGVHQKAKSTLVDLKQKYIRQYPECIASYGDTPSCSVADDFTGIDEIRPGNFVFYDLMQQTIGSCDHSDIAVALACPIVAIHNKRNEIVIYGGGIHLSKDSIMDDNNGRIYGQVVNKEKTVFGEIIPNMFLKGLSQEHGVVCVPPSEIDKFRIGDLLYVLPVHSCMTANLMKRYFTLDNREITMFNPL